MQKKHPTIHFFTLFPQKRTGKKKRKKKKTEMDISLFLVLEGDGERWEPLQDWSVSEACVPMSEDEGRRGAD